MARPLMALEIERDRGLFRYNGSKNIENSYLLNLTNKATEMRYAFIHVSGTRDINMSGLDEVKLRAGEKREIPIILEMDPASLRGEVTNITFEVSTSEEPEKRVAAPTTFLGPVFR
ncbi:FixG Ig-like domain-containing protein [Marinobacter salexigens]|nr:FixG Ig-like domain-containing protein [Marinobacter salexigens]